jgi:hypothetical protein
MESENFKLKSDSHKKLIEKPSIQLEEPVLVDLKKVNPKVVDRIEIQLKAREDLTKKKYFLK